MTLTWYSIIVSYKKLQINIVNIHWKLHKSSTKIQYNGEKENDKKTNKIVHRKHMNPTQNSPQKTHESHIK